MIRALINEEVEKIIGKNYANVVWNGVFGVYAVNLDSREKAEKIADSSKIKEYFTTEIAEKGARVFLNFSPSQDAIEEGLVFALQEKFDFAPKKNKTQVEFISANPTGPLTLGNGRGGVYGDVLASVLDVAGYDVTKEYYINDAGNQIISLYHSIKKDEMAEYKGKYIDDLSYLIKETGADEILTVGQAAANIILESIKKTVFEMGVEFDVWFSEQKELRDKGKVEEIIEQLKKKKLTYEKDGALWFKASEFGDSEDRVLLKTNKEPTYFCVDCAYHKNKFIERKFDKVINVWGADHHGDVARLKGFVETLGFKDKLEIILMQFVRLVEDGKAVRMSKREGKFVLAEDVIKEIGRDAFRYFMLTRSPDTHLDFDMDLAKEQSKKNPVYYVQYAHARMHSILAKSEIQNPKFETNPKFKTLNSKYERNLILKLIQFPEIIEDISKDYQVHHLTTYIYELAKTFTDFYENVRVLEAETDELKGARLELVFVAKQILGKGLSLMGISSPEKM